MSRLRLASAHQGLVRYIGDRTPTGHRLTPLVLESGRSAFGLEMGISCRSLLLTKAKRFMLKPTVRNEAAAIPSFKGPNGFPH